MIPTGSLAPTLLGAHFDVECPNCGKGQSLGYSDSFYGPVPEQPNSSANAQGRCANPR